MNKYLEEAKAMRQSINSLAKDMTDDKLIDNKALFPYWNGNGVSYIKDNIVQHLGELYKVIQSHTSQLDWSPDIVPSLFRKISLDEYPEWIQPTGAQDAYQEGDKCSHNDKHWLCEVDNNVWEPGVYGWIELRTL